MSAPNGGPVLFIQFPDCIIITAIDRGIDVEQKIRMKDSVNNRIIGTSCDLSKLYLPQPDHHFYFIFLTSDSGLLKIHVTFDKMKLVPCAPEDIASFLNDLFMNSGFKRIKFIKQCNNLYCMVIWLFPILFLLKFNILMGI